MGLIKSKTSGRKTQPGSRPLYTRELSKLLLVKFPPKSDERRCFGLTGNFLPVIVFARSRRKFDKMQGWYWTMHPVYNRVTRVSERMEFWPVEYNVVKRLWFRYKTVRKARMLRVSDIEVAPRSSYYLTVLDVKSGKIFLFYLDDKRLNTLKGLGNVEVKEFVFWRFNWRIVNFVTDNTSVIPVFLSTSTSSQRSRS